MNKCFKKAIIFSAVLSILAPQVSYTRCKVKDCEGPKNNYIDNVINEQSKIFFPDGSKFSEEVASMLKTPLHASYKADCFVQPAGVVVGAALGSTPLWIAATIAGQKRKKKNISAPAHDLFDKTFSFLDDSQKPKDEQETYIKKEVKNNKNLQESIGKMCDAIGKKLGYAFYTNQKRCWGNGMGQKLTLIRRLNIL